MTGDDLLERLEAAVAAAQLERGQTPDPGVGAALEALQGRQAEAVAALVSFAEWVNEGSEVLHALWDRLGDADSVMLVDTLRLLCDREAGLQPALGMLQRDMERVLGERHGRGAITDDDGTVRAAVDRAAGSVRWRVDEAWPAILQAIRKADRLAIGDPADGELEDDTARALRILKQLCGVSYLRVEACGQLGIDPDDYREKGNYRWTVKLP